jgi:SAM-dependent methyltransferase
MSGLTDKQDAYGHMMHDHYRNRGSSCEMVERDDGYMDAAISGARMYFSEYRDWHETEKSGIRFARGCVLDVGCGAGRVALYLQRRGHEVVGIDVSPLALKVCKLRGLKNARLLSITEVNRRLGMFDTIVMYGNNFGLFGSFQRARWLLRRFHQITRPGARIIAGTNDPYRTTNPDHLAYHRFNRRCGRMGGQVRIRIRYHKHISPYFDYLMVSKGELKQIVQGTGWKIDRFIESSGSIYIAVLVRQPM